MWKVRKFLTRKPDTKLKSRVFFSMRSNIFSSATWMDPFPIFIPPVKNCFDIVLSLTSKIILHIDHHKQKQNIYMEKFSFIFLEKVDKLLFDA